ncbi:6-hydroxy-D-nicotine oxidase [Rhizoctonia solani]|uniref:6-hydroxy-D-nicotine oxidase n=1 Tax=Rhizoctonia solani TaxID=456999 RepID=A0A0K6GJE9_9AGAM|nr:6-hydroxy-D-nicotine oxidase [Rhizoctonia solani]
MSPINSSALELLRKALSPNASVNLPGDPDYTNKRWARNAEKTAAIVTCPVTAEDVAQIIAFAQGKAPYDAQQKLDMAVKGGGHTPSGASSSEGGLVIDLNPKMHTVRVDPDAKLAYVQGGALWADVDEATFPHGLASVSGVVSHTGVGGLILGGGFGWLCSQYGLVVDNLARATVVTSSGSILTASDSENVDLFWAIRGGGANFGVVTDSVPKDATAYGNRAPTYNVGYFMNWSDPAWTKQSIPTVLALDKEFMKLRDAHFHRDLVGEGGYLNYQDAESQKAGASRRFGSHFPRLLEIKRKYDPENLFGKWSLLSPSASFNLPGDPGYSNKRWAANAERNAAAVACPATPEDVVQALAFAQGKAPYDSQQRLHLAVKGGGHTPSGASSSEGGLVIDLQPNMHSVRVDPDAKLAYVGGGCLWEEVDEATAPHGLASVAGIVGHTGVGGLTLGGGFGWLCSQHGLVIDNLVQATVVTSPGDILTASDSQNADLFWALRGGGANFGVVTEFVLKLHEQRPDLYTATLLFPPPSLEKVTNEINVWIRHREASTQLGKHHHT